MNQTAVVVKPSLVSPKPKKPPVGRALDRIKAAGKLLESAARDGNITINLIPGESEVEAILRTISELSESEQAILKSHVDWVEAYGFHDEESSPAKALMQRSRMR